MTALKLLQDVQNAMIGFEDLFYKTHSNYPPYNVVKTVDGDYVVTMALAGFKPEDVEVYQEGNSLYVCGTQEATNETYLVHGLANRNFKRRFTINSDVKVKGVNLKLGILTIILGSQLANTPNRIVHEITQ